MERRAQPWALGIGIAGAALMLAAAAVAARKRPPNAGSASRRVGEDAPPGTVGIAEQACPLCGGIARGRPCGNCAATGIVNTSG